MGFSDRLLDLLGDRTSTRSLLKNERLVAVHGPASCARTHRRYDEPAFLQQFAKSLLGSQSSPLSSKLLPYPSESLTLEFISRRSRTIKIGEKGKLTSACNVEIDGAIRIVKSPGLPNFPAT